MTLDEAIEILTEFNVTWSQASHKEKRLAIQLGIEALKQIKWLHESHVLHDDELLPGETKD